MQNKLEKCLHFMMTVSLISARKVQGEHHIVPKPWKHPRSISNLHRMTATSSILPFSQGCKRWQQLRQPGTLNLFHSIRRVPSWGRVSSARVACRPRSLRSAQPPAPPLSGPQWCRRTAPGSLASASHFVHMPALVPAGQGPQQGFGLGSLVDQPQGRL